MTIAFDNSYARELRGMYVPWHGAAVPAPELVLMNGDLARELGLDPDALRSPDGVAMLAGAAIPAGAEPLAMAYAGHQFGGFSPQLGDGRAMLLGEVIDRAGQRRDIHLKGSGRTPFARGGDGKAALGPMLREYILGEAMHALGIPTTRALAVTATGETVWRDTALPGAVLARIASSHLRVGTFQFLLARGDVAGLRRLADYAIARHFPDLAARDDRYLAFLAAVIDRQAALVAHWQAVGFVHGVMNTDNCAISGETIDYGPCAFVDAYDPGAVFSSIDRTGRYAYGNQPLLARWNLARLAETLLPLMAEDPQQAIPDVQALIEGAEDVFRRHWRQRMGDKLGIDATPADDALIDGFLDLLTGHDFTRGFRQLMAVAGGDDLALRLHLGPAADDWLTRWRARLAPDALARMARANPVYIARNHQVEAALSAATAGDLSPTLRLLDALSQPFETRAGFEEFEGPAPEGFGDYVTYCGT